MRWKQCIMSFQKQNLRYIEERCRCRVFAEASWSGVQNGITFTITHPQVSGIQEAEQLLNGILRKVGIRFQRTKNKQSGIKGKEWSDQSWRNLEKTSIWPVDFINIEMKFIYVFRWKKNCRDTFKHWKYHQMVSKNTKKKTSYHLEDVINLVIETFFFHGFTLTCLQLLLWNIASVLWYVVFVRKD